MMTPIRKKPDDVKRWRQSGRPGSKLLIYGIECSLLLALATSFGFAQGAAEYGSTMSGMAGSMSNINLMNKVKLPDLTSNGNSTVIMSQPSKDSNVNSNYILDSMKQGSVAINRKDLEQHAGANAAKLMLRSSPTDAYVKIDGKPVGRTPILLVVAPGQYDVVVDGIRMDRAEQKVDLLPKETREFSLTLTQLYPTRVMVQLH